LTAKTRTYRWFVYFALVLLLTPLIAACGGNQAATTPATTANQTEVAPGVETAVAPAGETEEAPAGETETAPAGETAAPAVETAAPAGETEVAGDGGAQGAPAEGAFEPGGECAAGQKGGTAVVSIQQEPEILDPFITGMTFSVWLLHALNVPLVRATPESNTLQPVLLSEVPSAENGGISENGLTYVLNFREGLKWSDGQPLDASDLVFTWKTIMDPQYGAGSQLGWDKIKDIKLSNNDRTATITLSEKYAPFFATAIAGSGATTGGFMLPEHAFKGMKPAQYAKSKYGAQGTTGHIGSGPFKMEAWKAGQSITMARNENYVGKKACLDKLLFTIVPEVDSQISLLQRGDNDLATNFYASDIPVLEKLQPQGVKVLAYPAYLVERYLFNFNDPKDTSITVDPTKAKKHPVFEDVRVRRAVALAINRPAIVEKLLFGKAEVAVNEWDNSPWFNEKLKPYPYDPEQAKKLLDEAGWKDTDGDNIRDKGGVKLSFNHSTTSGNAIRESIQRASISDLQKVGIEMKIVNHDPSKLFAQFSEGGVLSRRQFDMAGYTTGIGLDPDFSAYYMSSEIPRKAKPAGSNFGGYSNLELDKLWKQQATETDPAKRKALYDQIQQIMYDDVAIIWIYDRLQIDAAGPRFTAPKPDFTGYIWWAPEEFSMKK